MPSKYLITPANLITLTGIIAAILCMWNGHIGHKEWSLGFYLYAAVSDFFDGFVARWDMSRGGRGVSELGEKLDPIRDKLILLIPLIADWQLTTGLAILELASFTFAYQVRKKTGRHFIAPASKAMTFVQFIVIGVLILWPEESWLFAVLYITTLIRLSSYAIELKSINGLIIKNRS